jgi:arylsulfatase
LGRPQVADQPGAASNHYNKCKSNRAILVLPAFAQEVKFLASLKEFPPRQRPAGFTIGQALEKTQQIAAEK